MLSAQQSNDSEVQRLLYRCQLGLKFPQTRAEKLRSFILKIRICEFGHQYEHQLRIFRQRDAVYRLQVLQIRIAELRIMPVTALKADNHHDDNQQNTHHNADSHESSGFQWVESA